MEIYCVKEVEQNPVPKSQTKPFYIGTKEAPSDYDYSVFSALLYKPHHQETFEGQNYALCPAIHHDRKSPWDLNVKTCHFPCVLVTIKNLLLRTLARLSPPFPVGGVGVTNDWSNGCNC